MVNDQHVIKAHQFEEKKKPKSLEKPYNVHTLSMI